MANGAAITDESATHGDNLPIPPGGIVSEVRAYLGNGICRAGISVEDIRREGDSKRCEGADERNPDERRAAMHYVAMHFKSRTMKMIQ